MSLQMPGKHGRESPGTGKSIEDVLDPQKLSMSDLETLSAILEKGARPSGTGPARSYQGGDYQRGYLIKTNPIEPKYERRNIMASQFQ